MRGFPAGLFYMYFRFTASSHKALKPFQSLMSCSHTAASHAGSYSKTGATPLSDNMEYHYINKCEWTVALEVDYVKKRAGSGC